MPLRKISLGTKAVVALALALFVSAAVLTTLQYATDRRALTAQWEAKGSELAALLAFAVQPALESRDQRALARFVAQTMLVSDVKSITIVDAHGIIVADSRDQGIGKRLALHIDTLREALERTKEAVTWVETAETGAVRYVLSPVTSKSVQGGQPGHVIGALLIGMDPTVVDQAARSNLHYLLFINGLVFAVLLILLWIIVRIGLLRPLAVLAKSARAAPGIPRLSTAPGARQGEIEALSDCLTHMTEVLRDATRGKDSEGNVHAQDEQSAARLDGLYKTLPIGLMYLTSNLLVERVSHSFADWHGRRAEDYLGQRFPSLIAADRWAKLRPILEHVLHTGTAYHALEEEVADSRVPGGTRFLTCHLYPDLADDGTVRGIHFTAQDVTAQRHALKEHERHLNELTAKNRELDQMAIRDPLTGLYNRRFFDEALTREWQQFQRSGEPFTVIIMDVDAFKSINDEHGHETGDRALQQVGNTLRANLRESDLTARVGGDEFAALLPRTDTDHGEQVLDKLRQVLAKLRVNTSAGDIYVSLSLGSATVPGFPPVSSAAELLRVADKRMYGAKRMPSARRPDG